jgi:hypothetical protein
MKVQEIMDRVGINLTGKAIAYIKDGLREINMLHETHVETVDIDIKKDTRFYAIDKDIDIVKIKDIRVKNHLNTKDEYRSIPRAIGEPVTEDPDGR